MGRFIVYCEETVECLHLIFETGNESRVSYTAKPGQKWKAQSTISPCQCSLLLQGRICVFCVIVVGKVKAHISLSLVYYVGLIGRCMLFLVIYVQRTTHEDTDVLQEFQTLACRNI